MIAFGASITDPETFERFAAPGLELAAERDSAILALQSSGSLPRTYNLILDRASHLDGLEALVLLHEDAEIVDPGFGTKLRRALSDRDAAVIGCAGATGARGIAWWDGDVVWPGSAREPRAVDVLWGYVLALSPWAVRALRFDESLGPRHGHDADLCRQARAAGRSVLATELGVVHHHSRELVARPEPWVAAHMRAADKWEAGEDPDWPARARRAEAQAAAARLLVASRQLHADALTERLEQRLRAVTGTRSWRVTEPLRRLNARRRRG